MARQILSIEPEYEFVLAGINSPAPCYRLVWDINLVLQWQLERVHDFVIQLQGSEIRMAQFAYLEFDENINCSLVANKQQGLILLPELPHYDYILKMNDPSSLPELLRSMRRVRTVSACFEIGLEQLRTLHQLAQL